MSSHINKNNKEIEIQAPDLLNFQSEFVDPAMEHEFFLFDRDRAIRDARIAIVILVLPMLLFVRTDYELYGLTGSFYLLAAARFIFTTFSIWLFLNLAHTNTSRKFKLLSHLFLVLLLVVTVLITTHRPPTYLMFMVVDLACILILFMLLQSGWLYLSLLIGAYAVVSLAVILPTKVNIDPAMLRAIYASYPLILVSGAYGARRMNQYRRNIFNALKQETELRKSLQQAFENVEKLEGLLPICAYCKKIRDEGGEWHKLEAYIMEHSDTQFSHGICKDCIQRVAEGS